MCDFYKVVDRRGFTLVEMSVVLIIIGLIILVVYPGIASLRMATQQQATNTALDSTTRALAAFVQANGRLPCPAPASSIGSGFGRVGTCNSSSGKIEGIVPFISIGLPPGLVKDGWGNWLTYAVDKNLTDTNLVLPMTGSDINKALCNRKISTSPSTALKVWLQNKSITPAASAPAAFVLISHGARGCGAYIADVTSNGINGERKPCQTSSEEAENADGNRDYYSLIKTNTFDDEVRWLDRNALVSLVGNVACQSTW